MAATDRHADRLLRDAVERHRAGDREGARLLYARACEAVPAPALALHGLGCLAFEAGDAATAIALIGRAAAAEPRNGAFRITLSRALLARGHAEAARASAALACLALPGAADAHAAHGAALIACGRQAEARDAFDRALHCAPGHVEARLARARAALARGDRAAALPDFEALARALPADTAAQANLGVVLLELDRREAAVAALDRAVALAPDGAAGRGMRGLARLRTGDVAGALDDLARAHRAEPGSPVHARNLAAGLYEADRRGEARALLDAALARDPADAAARFTLACLDLAEDRFAPGWRGFESRAGAAAGGPPGIARWDGAPLAGTLLLLAEQGLGDTLMFLRYAPLARARAHRVVLALPAALHRLAGPLGEIADLDRPGDAAGTAAAWCRLGSLPALLGTGAAIPPPADPGLGPRPPRAGGPLRVGLAWQGERAYLQDRRRSIPPGLLAPLAGVAAVSLVSLQRGEPPPGFLRDSAPPPEDLRDTASLVAGLDLVVTVDSAVAHLAGMAGTPTWLLDRVGGDWRWGRGRRDSAWYPSLEIFRATAAGPPAAAWEGVVAAVAARLAALAAAAAATSPGPPPSA